MSSRHVAEKWPVRDKLYFRWLLVINYLKFEVAYDGNISEICLFRLASSPGSAQKVKKRKSTFN